MKTHTVTTTTYTASELKGQCPIGFKCALQHWQDNQHEIFWEEEIFDSLKACLKAAGITLLDWSLGAHNPNYVKLRFSDSNGCYEDEVENLKGKRAFAWLENNLFGALRVRGNTRIDDWTKYRDPATGFLMRGATLDKSARYYRTLDGKLHRREGRIGEIPSCPITGVCYDEDYLDALRKAVEDGDTIKEAFSGLAGVCQRLLEREAEDQASEEYFVNHADANDYEFESSGRRYYA